MLSDSQSHDLINFMVKSQPWSGSSTRASKRAASRQVAASALGNGIRKFAVYLAMLIKGSTDSPLQRRLARVAAQPEGSLPEHLCFREFRVYAV